MSNNCLVTKLKGTVQNNNLPEYKTIYLNLFGQDRWSASSGTSTFALLIGVGQGKSVTISSLYPFHPSVATAQAVTEFIAPSNSITTLMFMAAEMPTVAVENAIKITGDIYDLTALNVYGPTLYGAMIDITTKTPKNSIESLNYSTSLISRACSPDEKVSNDIQVLDIQDWPITNNKDYSDMFNIGNNVKYLTSETAQGGAKQGVPTSCLSKLGSIHTILVRPLGDINLLPLSLKVMAAPGSLATGSIEGFVADRRTKGKTTGNLAIGSPHVSWNITYNGTPLKEIPDSIVPSVDGYAYLCWDANNIWWASEKPEDIQIYSSPYWATKAVLDGEL